MTVYDIFNGDADGLCALRQWRLAHPAASVLVTGVKRDNALLERVSASAGDEANVFDIGLRQNLTALDRLLAAGVRVRYFDHHGGAVVPRHERLSALIDTSPTVCTSTIVDSALDGRFRSWAIVGAFGDNMGETGAALAASLAADADTVAAWRRLGEALNYNAYGSTVADLAIDPAALYRRLECHAEPLQFLEREPVVPCIERMMRADLALAAAQPATVRTGRIAIYELPDLPWARRVVGTLANLLVRQRPDEAVAILVPEPARGVTLSLRVPAGSTLAAGEFAGRFGGGGRRSAAGCIGLTPTQVQEVREQLLAEYA